MKKNMLMACGILIAFMPLHAQVKTEHISLSGNEKLQDTIAIYFGESSRIFFIGNDMMEMMKYHKSDSLKMLFLSDWEKALASGQLGEDVTLVHYFVHESGKRRIKAENAEYSERTVDPAYEIKRLDMDLPRYRYIIYDTRTGYRWEIYCADPAKLRAGLEKLSIDIAVSKAASRKKYARLSYKTEVSALRQDYRLLRRVTGRNTSIEVTPTIGFGLFGSKLAPVFGGDAYFVFHDKYSAPLIGIGIGTQAYCFAEVTGTEISGLSFVNASGIKFLLNYGNSQRVHWLGIQANLLFTEHSGVFKNAYSYGLVVNGVGMFNYQFNIIRGNDRKSIYGLTVTFPF